MAAADLRHEDIDGVRYWFAEPAPARRPAAPTVHLLQGYDEYVSYGESRFVLDVSGAARMAPRERSTFHHLVVLDSQVVGHWKRTVKVGGVLIEAALYRPFDRAQAAALQVAADRHADFLGGLAATVRTTRLQPRSSTPRAVRRPVETRAALRRTVLIALSIVDHHGLPPAASRIRPLAAACAPVT